MVCVKWTKKVGDEESPDSSPGPRSGHTAVALGLPNDERVLFYGGIRDKKFLGDLKVKNVGDLCESLESIILKHRGTHHVLENNTLCCGLVFVGKNGGVELFVFLLQRGVRNPNEKLQHEA